MHIEPGVVDGAKIALSYATAAASVGLVGRMAVESLRRDGGAPALLARSAATTLLTLACFEVLPHHPVGVSEVHLILGSTLFLMFGGGAAAIGLMLGLLIQGLAFEPADLPQYGMNLTTLIVPMWAMSELARRIIPARTAYVDLAYRDVLALSAAYQAGVVAWVAFWAFYGHGVTMVNVAAVGSFGLAYLAVVAIEPLVGLAALAAAKGARAATSTGLFNARLHRAA